MQTLRETDDTFCIAVLGDFLGSPSTGSRGPEGSWVPRRATPDSVLRLLGWRPSVRVRGPDLPGPTLIELRELEDFGPQSLFERLDLFAPFRDARAAAREGRPLPSWLTGGVPGSPPSGAGPPQRDGGDGEPPGRGAAAPGQGLLDAILDVAQPPELDTVPRTREELQNFVKAVVRPHLVRPDTEGPARVAAVDEAAGTLMSALLHDPAFQELEGLWRSLVLLLSRVDTSGKVRIFAVNVPREDLVTDLLAGEGGGGGRLLELLSHPDLGAPARRWGLALGAYTFGAGPGDQELLAAIGRVARSSDVPWISSFDPDAPEGAGDAPVGGFPPEWDSLRQTAESAWIGLTHPRFLAREPFDVPGRPGRSFAFRESVSSRRHLLWGHGGFLCAALMAQGYAARGWTFRMEEWMELVGMPQVSLPYAGEGDPPPVSTSRTLDTEEANRLIEAGLVPLLPFPSRATVRLGGIRSISAGGHPIQGWWRR